jgi:hypothetical protein
MHHFFVNNYHFCGVAGLLQSLHWRISNLAKAVLHGVYYAYRIQGVSRKI